MDCDQRIKSRKSTEDSNHRNQENSSASATARQMSCIPKTVPSLSTVQDTNHSTWFLQHKRFRSGCSQVGASAVALMVLYKLQSLSDVINANYSDAGSQRIPGIMGDDDTPTIWRLVWSRYLLESYQGFEQLLPESGLPPLFNRHQQSCTCIMSAIAWFASCNKCCPEHTIESCIQGKLSSS